MSTRESTEDRARRLKRLAGESPGAAGIKEITLALGLKNNHVVAAAAGVAGAWAEASCVEALVAAFDRFMTEPVKRDPGCVAKVAIVQALHELECSEFELFLRAARHVQHEPVFGGREDTGAPLRVAGVSALTELRYPDTDFILADLMSDPEPSAREGAVHILGKMGGRTAQLLLRTRARMPDADPSIVGMCHEGLMKIDGPGSMEFVADFLQSDRPAVIEQAALAIGEARLPESFARLRETWDGYIQDRNRELLLLGIALTRTQESVAFLLDLVRDGQTGMAVAAIEALAFYRDDSAKAEAVVDAAGSRSESEVKRAINVRFDSD